MADPSFGVVLPTYREEANIEDLLGKVAAAAPEAAIVLVDDSPDMATVAAVERFRSAHPASAARIDIMHRTDARGRASAVRAGIRHLLDKGFDYIVEMDTDGSHPPEQLPALVAAAAQQQAAIAIASRDVPGAEIVGWPWSRHLLHFLANASCRLLLRLGIRDYMNAYRAYSADAAATALREGGKISTGFWAFGEVLAHVVRRGGKVIEIPTFFLNRTRGESSVRLATIIGCAVELLQVFLLLQRLRQSGEPSRP